MGKARRITGYVFFSACAGFAVSVFVAPYINGEHSAAFNQYFTVAGVVITAVAFCFGAYFAVLAVSAYSHHRDIEALARKTKDRADRIETIEGELGRVVRGVEAHSSHLYGQMDSVFVSFQYSDILPYDHKERFFKELSVSRAIVALQNPSLDENRKISNILRLAEFRDRGSTQLLKRLADDEHEPRAVRHAAQNALRVISEK